MARVRAPELVGSGGWVNTTRPLTLRDLRGRVVVLDFWTEGCINCIHVVRELAWLERELGDLVTVVGIHSPKFARERDHGSVVDAVRRLGVHHPVLDDPEMVTWDAYAVRGWPTLVVLDADGRIALVAAGEGHRYRVAALVRRLVEEAEAAGTLARGPLPEAVPGAEIPPLPPTRLLFPGDVAAVALDTPGGRRDLVAVADTGHHRVVVLEPSGGVVAVAGSGVPGHADGDLLAAGFRSPQGVAAWDGRLAVADTGNHRVRVVDLVAGTVATAAGSGARGSGPLRPGRAATVALPSPWAVAPWEGGLAIALAGAHQLALLDPGDAAVGPLAGTGAENIVDGPAAEALLAQPSGLATAPEGLLIADAESSALRMLRDGRVETVIGQGLFVFGHRDGQVGDALLQHPTGLAVTPGGAVLVADTYNGAIRAVGLSTGRVATLVTGLSEPGGVAALPDGTVLVADTGAHRLVRVDGGEVRAVPLAGLSPPA